MKDGINIVKYKMLMYSYCLYYSAGFSVNKRLTDSQLELEIIKCLRSMLNNAVRKKIIILTSYMLKKKSKMRWVG